MSVLGRFTICRKLAATLAPKPDFSQYHLSFSSFITVNTDKIAESLRQDGYYLDIKLPEPILQEVWQFSQSNLCYGDGDYHYGFVYPLKAIYEKRYGKQFYAGQYFNTSLLCPAIRRLGSDPYLLEIAAKYLQAEPVFTGSRLWWIFPVDHTPYDFRKTVSFFHYDLDDYQCLRFFFYITDVDSFSGPHVCIRGSHLHKRLDHVLLPVKRREDQAMIDYYQPENVITICGEAGFGFAEDTFCFHKATQPLKRDRLMLQLQFALRDYGNHHDRADLAQLQSPLVL